MSPLIIIHSASSFFYKLFLCLSSIQAERWNCSSELRAFFCSVVTSLTWSIVTSHANPLCSHGLSNNKLYDTLMTKMFSVCAVCYWFFYNLVIFNMSIQFCWTFCLCYRGSSTLVVPRFDPTHETSRFLPSTLQIFLRSLLLCCMNRPPTPMCVTQ